MKQMEADGALRLVAVIETLMRSVVSSSIPTTKEAQWTRLGRSSGKCCTKQNVFFWLPVLLGAITIRLPLIKSLISIVVAMQVKETAIFDMEFSLLAVVFS